MAKYSANFGLVHTFGLFGGGQRWQVVTPIIATSSLVPADAAKEVVDWMSANVITLYQAILAADCQIIGQSCEPMRPGNALPYRENYADGTYPGSVSGQSYSQQVSVLTSWYSTTQVNDGPKVHTGKSFWCPPPESKCAQQVLDATYAATTVGALADKIMTGFLGGTGTQYYRGLAAKHGLTDNVYQVDYRSLRSSVFTQRRRLTPIF